MISKKLFEISMILKGFLMFESEDSREHEGRGKKQAMLNASKCFHYKCNSLPFIYNTIRVPLLANVYLIIHKP